MALVKKIVFAILTVCLASIVAFLLAAHFTGKDARAYEVLPFDRKIEINGKLVVSKDFAEIFQPKIFADTTHLHPKILWAWYEIVETKDNYDIIYYNCWEDEIVPKKSSNFLYSIYRSVYYGYPLYDIEYLMVKVKKGTFKPEKITFDTSIDKDYEKEIVIHYTNALYANENNTYKSLISDKADNLIDDQGNLAVETTDLKVHLGINTWNHMLEPITQTNKAIYPTLENSNLLKPLTDEDYSNYKFSRKGQSEHVTKTNNLMLWLLTAVFFMIFTVLVFQIKRRLF